MNVAAAYAHCEAVTRSRAANFSYGIRLLAPPKRRALSAVYALSRRIDDIGDGDLPPEEKLRRLEAARTDLDRDRPDDPVLVALADAAGRFPIPMEAFAELIEGVETDVRGASYETFEDLVGYARRVAGSIGRLSLGVFGSRRSDAPRRADQLGIAMQLTNILRDVREDQARGRVYLPREDLDAFGCRPELNGSPALPRLIAFEAARARRWFYGGLRLLGMLDRRSRACVAAMAGIYRGILDRIERDPGSVLRRRVALPAWEKTWVAARSLAGGRA